MKKALLLNADYQPIDVISWQKAITKVMDSNSSVYVYKFYENDFIIDSKGRHHPSPCILVMKKYIAKASQKCPYTKANILARDDYTCQYCGQRFSSEKLTVDHIKPKCSFPVDNRGAASVFTNTVTACCYCNTYKADQELGKARYPKSIKESWLKDRAGSFFVLKKQPTIPNRVVVFKSKINHMSIPDEWREILNA